MVYYDNTGRRIHLTVRRRTMVADNSATDADAAYIRQVASENPRFTADEVYAEICYGRRRNDITKQMVRAALA